MAKKRTRAHAKPTSPVVAAVVGTIEKFPDDAWVEVQVEGEWRLCRIRFFIGKDPWVCFSPDGFSGRREFLHRSTPARQGRAPEGDAPLARSSDEAEVDPMMKR